MKTASQLLCEEFVATRNPTAEQTAAFRRQMSALSRAEEDPTVSGFETASTGSNQVTWLEWFLGFLLVYWTLSLFSGSRDCK